MNERAVDRTVNSMKLMASEIGGDKNPPWGVPAGFVAAGDRALGTEGHVHLLTLGNITRPADS